MVTDLFYTGYPRIDLECSGTEKYVQDGYLRIPYDAVLELTLPDGEKLYGKVNMDEEENNGLKIGEDYHLDGPLSNDVNRYHGSETIKLMCFHISPGGGPVNKVIASNRLLNSIRNGNSDSVLKYEQPSDISVSAVLLNSNDFIRRSILPAMYYPLVDDNGVGYNINLHLSGGSINIRHVDPKPRAEYEIKHASTSTTKGEKGSVITFDSMQHERHSQFLTEMFNPLEEKRVVLSATDTMTKNLGRDELKRLLSRSEFITSNLDEFRKFCKKIFDIQDKSIINSWEELYRYSTEVGNKQKNGGVVYITLGEHGGVLYRNKNLWFHPTRRYSSDEVFGEHGIRTTVKLGDTADGVAIPFYIANYPDPLVLAYGNSAGQLRAETEPTKEADTSIMKLHQSMNGMDDVHLYSGYEESFSHRILIRNNHY